MLILRLLEVKLLIFFLLVNKIVQVLFNEKKIKLHIALVYVSIMALTK